MSEVEKFNFTAPQFVESLADVDLEDGADKFFDAEESMVPTVASTNTKSIDLEQIGDNCEPVAPDTNLTNAVDNLSKDCNDENKEPWSTKSHGGGNRLPRMSVKKLTPSSRKNSKFMSLAEQVHKFHHGTPPRFKRKSGVYRTRSSKLLPTIAMSPLLQTKARSRASTVQPDIQFKRPVLKPMRSMAAKPPPKPAPKPPTVPQPFNLTDVNKFKKVNQLDLKELPDVFNKAKSTVAAKKPTLPKMAQKEDHVAEPSGSKPKASLAPSTTQKPVNIKKKTIKLEGDKIVASENWAITGLKARHVKPPPCTKTIPFSFEKRDQARLKAKLQKTTEGSVQQKSPIHQ